MRDTIYGGSNLGRWLQKLPRNQKLELAREGKAVPIVDRITIGRDRDNTLRLEDDLVSRHHAIVQKIRRDYFVTDAGSTNGTFVNDVRVPEGSYARLGRGDVLRVGRTEFTLR